MTHGIWNWLLGWMFESCSPYLNTICSYVWFRIVNDILKSSDARQRYSFRRICKLACHSHFFPQNFQVFSFILVTKNCTTSFLYQWNLLHFLLQSIAIEWIFSLTVISRKIDLKQELRLDFPKNDLLCSKVIKRFKYSVSFLEISAFSLCIKQF